MKTGTKQRSRDFAEGDVLNKDSQYTWAEAPMQIFYLFIYLF